MHTGLYKYRIENILVQLVESSLRILKHTVASLKAKLLEGIEVKMEEGHNVSSMTKAGFNFRGLQRYMVKKHQCWLVIVWLWGHSPAIFTIFCHR